MGLFNKPLLPAHYENEDVQISAELCSNITITVVGLARGEITILSGNEDMVQIKTSVQAKESILKNAAALEPVQDGNRYTYTIHTPLEEKLGRSVNFQVFVTIPRNLDSLESFTIQGANVELSMGNIRHTFIRHLAVHNEKGDISIDSFYGESAILKSSTYGSICGKYSLARLVAQAKSGKIQSDVYLLNTDETQPSPRVICSTFHHPVNVTVDGTDLFEDFRVEAKTQCQPLDVKILLANTHQKLLGNFINFGGPTRIKVSGNYQGRVETRTHYGKIIIDEPEFERIEGAMLSSPSLSDRNSPALISTTNLSSSVTSSTSSTHRSTDMSSRTSSQGSAGWDRDDPRYHQSYLNYPYDSKQNHPHGSSAGGRSNTTSMPGSAVGSGTSSRANSINDSIVETRSTHTIKSEKERKKKEEESTVTKELIGTIGQGGGLIMAKNSSGDITLTLI
ncbi:hypothetical protein BGZ98_000201 [Dissophora globulifera]|nr:hypothetical protein BGZ98_000201 [Dissophora globulifera]